MAKNTLFSLNSSGQLVYRYSGRKAPSYYWASNNTVYDSRTGRKAGTVSYTKKAKTKAKTSKKKTQKSKISTKTKKSASKQQKKKVTKKAASAAKKAGKAAVIPQAQDQTIDFSDLENSEFTDEEYQYPDEIIQAFAESVKTAMNRGIPAWLQIRIQKLDPYAIWNAYQLHQYVFDVYFTYNPDGSVKSADNAAHWLVSVVEQIEQMGVSHSA